MHLISLAKRRDSTNDHVWFDTSRGATKFLQSAGDAAEKTSAANKDTESLDSDGFRRLELQHKQVELTLVLVLHGTGKQMVEQLHLIHREVLQQQFNKYNRWIFNCYIYWRWKCCNVWSWSWCYSISYYNKTKRRIKKLVYKIKRYGKWL